LAASNLSSVGRAAGRRPFNPDDDPGWPNRPTWALVCWLHAYRYIYLMEVSLARWQGAETGMDRSRGARQM
jgi:hypothetical protein